MKYSVKNNRTEVQPMVNAMIQYCKEHVISDEISQDMGLVLEEILTNIIKYSYDDTLNHEIVVEIEKDAESLQLRVEDDGRPFDSTGFYNPDIEKDFEDRNIGGMGIHLIRSLMDEMRYEFTQGRNILIVKKNLY
ncbi:MAG: ATP-binding protein [Desulforhopalus sp.]|nr:ATP-binding protein [Desulforhopalus sp.]